jgi:hypothetical protein
MHVVALDLVASALVVLLVWKARLRVVSLPLIATYIHWSIQSRLVRAPQSTLSWGLTTVAVGFGLLIASVFASWQVQKALANGSSRATADLAHDVT